MKKNNTSLLDKLNIAKIICDNLSEKHTDIHRMGVGVIIVCIGVGIAEIHVNTMVHVTCEAFGYFIHGLGCVPFIDFFTKNKN